MNNSRTTFLLFTVIVSMTSYGQLWKQYSDSADMFRQKRNTDSAILYYNKAEKELKRDSAGTLSEATNHISLGNVYFSLAQFDKAQSLFFAAKQVRETILGKTHDDYAAACNNIAIVYAATGQYKKAELYFLESKQIREKVLGKQNRSYASVCNNLGYLYFEMGKFNDAEALLIEARALRKHILGGEHPQYIETSLNLGNLYFKMGQYSEAETIYLENKEIVEKIMGKDHPTYASICGNLGVIYSDMGQNEKAGPFYIEAKKIREKVLGKEHPGYAEICNNLGTFYQDMGNYQEAEILLNEGNVTYAKIYGKVHPSYAASCYCLGNFYATMNQYNKAMSYLETAKQIWENSVDKKYSEYTETCFSLARLYWNMKQHNKSLAFYKEAYSSRKEFIKEIFQFTSESEKSAYIKSIDHRNQELFSFSFIYPGIHQELSYNASLTNRNLILSFSQRLRKTIYNARDTAMTTKYNSWVNLREQISFWNTKPVTDRPDYLKDLIEQTVILEKELARLSLVFKSELDKKEISWKNIQKNLKTNEAAIEFVEFNYYNSKRWTDSIYYIALVLKKDMSGPELIRLFEKRQFDALENSFIAGAIDNKINGLYSANAGLYNLIWKPLERHLKGISKIYYSPAGDLFKLSFAALPVDHERVLSDKYQLIQLNTTANIMDNSQGSINAVDTIELYGGIDYNADSSILKQIASSYLPANESLRSLPDDFVRGGGFQYLPGSLKEVEGIKSRAPHMVITMQSGVNATEESFKSLNGPHSPSILHIATHGFFFPDPKNYRSGSIQHEFERSGRAFKQSDNPLFRSGILFAGANNAWVGAPVKGIEDGILTAYEVSNMYLPNTKLVVLSACETALGDIQGNEGVYGLQRAFNLAGVKNLVMSLWKVPDAETSEFMQLFYANLFAKQTITHSFYSAQKIMKNKYRDSPYKWAAWILVR